MPRGRKKKSVVDATSSPEAPAKVVLAGDRSTMASAQKIGFAVTCLNNASTLLTSKSVYESPIDSEDPADAVIVASIERKKMAVKAVQRAIEICERVLFELDAEKTDESNSW
jgi:hypothetical protein